LAHAKERLAPGGKPRLEIDAKRFQGKDMHAFLSMLKLFWAALEAFAIAQGHFR